MIHDKICNMPEVVPKDYREMVQSFLKSLTPEMAEGEYPIKGDEIFARIMSYPTKTAEECMIEAHDVYVDIQFTLTGAEGITVYNRGFLEEAVAYNEKNDVVFFQKKGAEPVAHTVNLPSYFTLLMPDEAHQPQIREAGCDYVKKGVIKIKAQLF